MDQKTQRPAEQGGETPNAVCARCGVIAEDTPPPVTWTCSAENGQRQYVCGDCARDNIRAIEGRLDSAWW